MRLASFVASKIVFALLAFFAGLAIGSLFDSTLTILLVGGVAAILIYFLFVISFIHFMKIEG